MKISDFLSEIFILFIIFLYFIYLFILVNISAYLSTLYLLNGESALTLNGVSFLSLFQEVGA